MKKKIIIIIISSFILVMISYIAFLGIEGYRMLNNSDYNKISVEDQRLIDSQASLIEKYIDYNFSGVKEVTFTGVTTSPMGIPTIEGFVNDNKGETFGATIYDDKFSKSFNFDSVNLQEKYPKKKPTKSIEEIEAEEALK